MQTLRFVVLGTTLTLLLLTTACGRKHAPSTGAMTRVKLGYEQRGIASWYGPPYHGRRTASGEVYDMERMTAAHPRLPFGVTTRVENLTNGRSVEVRINDRGPFVKGRIIDLSRAAARQIDLLGPGVAQVKIKVIAAPINVRAELNPPRRGGTSPRSRFAFLLRPWREARPADDSALILALQAAIDVTDDAFATPSVPPHSPDEHPAQE